MDGLEWKTLLKWMSWGYHYFRKHPCVFPRFVDLLDCKHASFGEHFAAVEIASFDSVGL